MIQRHGGREILVEFAAVGFTAEEVVDLVEDEFAFALGQIAIGGEFLEDGSAGIAVFLEGLAVQAAEAIDQAGEVGGIGFAVDGLKGLGEITQFLTDLKGSHVEILGSLATLPLRR